MTKYLKILVRKNRVFPKKLKYSDKHILFMTIEDSVKVGKKGEILPKKPLREKSGINPGDNVLIIAHPGELIIRKIYSVEEALAMPIIASGTAKSMKEDIRKEAEIQERLTNEEH